MCKDALDSIKKGANNCPIVLENFTFNIFSHYFTTRRNEKQKYLSKQTYGGIWSELCHLYQMSGVTMGDKFKNGWDSFLVEWNAL